MATTIAQRVVKGDILIERDNGKKRMILVKKVQHTVCSRTKVHINDLCYDWNAVVDLAEADGTLGDLETALGDLDSDYDDVLTDAELLAEASRFVKQ